MAAEFFYEYVPLDDGSPNSFGIVKTYEAGTTIPKATYPTYADAVAGTNPNATTIILAADGVVTFWLDGAYKIDIQDANGVSLDGWPKDNINASGVVSAAAGNRNYIINGDFSVWQRAVTQTANGYGSDDRFANTIIGSTQVVTRQAATLGSSASQYYSRTVVTSVPGAGNLAVKNQSVEDVTRLAGQVVTISFDAWSDVDRNIAIEIGQNFGLGGAPSANVNGIGSQLVAITTARTRYSVTIAIPSITGKTLGTTANTSATQLFLWMDAGSTYAARSANLGQQSGTFNWGDIDIRLGTVSLPFEAQSPAETLANCQRYYEVASNAISGYCAGASLGRFGVTYKATKRVVPTMALATGVAYINAAPGNPLITGVSGTIGVQGASVDATIGAPVLVVGQGCTAMLGSAPGVDALTFDAEF
jgi:hypothetical protein